MIPFYFAVTRTRVYINKMVIFQFEMTNDETSPENSTNVTAGSPGLPESDASEGDSEELCSLPDEVFSALESNLSPLIKEELRSTIRKKRIGSGMEDLVIDDSPKLPSQVSFIGLT